MKHKPRKVTFVVYSDLEKENKHGYEVKAVDFTEDMLIIRPQVVPGLFGYPDMHINVLIVEGIRIFSYTDYALTDTKKAEIEREAIKLLQQHRARN